ncbi:Nodulation protein I (Nod factor ABC transporter, ATPase component) [Bradyrhizobium sp. ORS 285]|uniref:nodulation factor ABC transporter ATP-binding protein NodI n=1 Tax=Bradyrhizobium sp. ORS 285 TaxID=115808 RepID=UPI000240ABFC|nr:nodulation factor ABC transporter ATP-binding protein NodI [Bradyrhizobium sp. ORS 285]CCA64459.1 Nodulation protein I (Nod factor ABC transporter, ATPase component) [Bradyrhizobium sp. ORS 285]CCA64465.1 Nodulation protein I (Nod factor ABC transporter, ATPase component) [Bradyrhizobium sp. ORS 285]CCD87679.1 Nodulation protein I (Nod factor ABC transporter, ATPase component) [Bradyrhizobium sp. ORS 285]SMX56617.1 Nodulation protein I (Nod factor ABC transporter, ATPase component) [Bradyrhi
MSHIAVDVRNVTKVRERRKVVDRLRFSVNKGECFGLLGPNGSGKSTILRMLLGLIRADSGDISVLGSQVPDQSRLVRSRIGVVPQSDNLENEFTVRENLALFGRYFGMRQNEIQASIPSLLEFSCLENRASWKVSDLSGGMKRRLVLARAMINNPDLLIMDEPTTALDPPARHIIWDRLRVLLGKGKTILLSTHFMEEAERLCDRICVLDEGHIIAQGKPADLIETVVGCDVLEIYGDDPGKIANLVKTHATRVEVSGETVYCYSSDIARVRERLQGGARLRLMERSANLEDVFLRLTGRELEA